MAAYALCAHSRGLIIVAVHAGFLAVALWRRSPLARRDVASAVQVDAAGSEPSLFSYGLTIRDGEIDPESLPPAGVRADHWIDGGATMVQSGAPDSIGASQAVLFWIVPLAAPSGRASFDHSFREFENIERSAETSLAIGYDGRKTVDILLPFGVVNLIGSL